MGLSRFSKQKTSSYSHGGGGTGSFKKGKREDGIEVRPLFKSDSPPRDDQICFKLYATVDQGPTSKHYTDLKYFKPNKDELEKAKQWCITHDPSEGFVTELEAVVNELSG